MADSGGSSKFREEGLCYWGLLPSGLGWEQNDRRILCIGVKSRERKGKYLLQELVVGIRFVCLVGLGQDLKRTRSSFYLMKRHPVGFNFKNDGNRRLVQTVSPVIGIFVALP